MLFEKRKDAGSGQQCGRQPRPLVRLLTYDLAAQITNPLFSTQSIGIKMSSFAKTIIDRLISTTFNNYFIL